MHQKSAGHSPLPPISFPNSYVMIRFAAAIISECLKTEWRFLFATISRFAGIFNDLIILSIKYQ